MNMKETTYAERHGTFGWNIDNDDFNTTQCGHNENGFHYAERIAKDLRFDEQCRKNCIIRDSKKGEKND